MEYLHSFWIELFRRKEQIIERYIGGNIFDDVINLMKNGYYIIHKLPDLSSSNLTYCVVYYINNREPYKIIFIHSLNFDTKYYEYAIKGIFINAKIFAKVDYINKDLSKLNMTNMKNNPIIRHYYKQIALPKVVYN